MYTLPDAKEFDGIPVSKELSRNKLDKSREISRGDFAAAKEYCKHSRSRGIPLPQDAILPPKVQQASCLRFSFSSWKLEVLYLSFSSTILISSSVRPYNAYFCRRPACSLLKFCQRILQGIANFYSLSL
jgi:hypothetical protein